MHFSTVVFRTVWPNWQQSRLLRLALSSFSKLATFLYFKCYFSAFIAGTNVTYDKKKHSPRLEKKAQVLDYDHCPGHLSKHPACPAGPPQVGEGPANPAPFEG